MNTVESPTSRRCVRPLFIVALMAAQACWPCSLPRLMAQTVTQLRQSGDKNLARTISPSSTGNAGIDKAALDNAIIWAKQEDLCLTPVTLKVTDASLEEILAQLRLASPALAGVEIRLHNPARFSLDLPHAPVGKILQAAAALMGGNLYVFTDHLLIAAPQQLAEDERTEARAWPANATTGGWSARGIARNMIVDYLAIALGKPSVSQWIQAHPGQSLQDSTLTEPLTTTHVHYGELAPDAKVLLQQLIQWPINKTGVNQFPVTPPPLSNDTLVILNYDMRYSRLEVGTAAQPNPYVWESGMSPEMRQRIAQARAQRMAHPQEERAPAADVLTPSPKR